MAGRGATPWRLLAGLAVVLFVLLPGRAVYGKVGESGRRAHRVNANATAVDRRARAARQVDLTRLRADLDAVTASMPSGGIEAWIDGVSALARSTGTTWRSGTVGPAGGGAVTPGEAGGTTVSIVVEGATPALLAFVDQLRVAPPRLTLVDDFSITIDAKDMRRSTVTLKVRLLTFVPADPPPPAAV
jgi:hypothetical protein